MLSGYSGTAMGDHDHTYKLLFAHPQMVRDLLEGFVGGAWLQQLDFTTLERVSDNYVSDDLRARADDIVWRVRCGDQDVYLLLEFQSSAEPFMAVRVLTYVGLLYQDLIRARSNECDGGLPAILPIVLHNGSSRWRAAEDLATLLTEVPEGLEQYGPQLRYLLIDEGSYDDSELARSRNLVAMLFRLENCRRQERLVELVRDLVDWLRATVSDGLRRAFAVWLERVILARLPRELRKLVDNLWEKPTMLSETIDRWEQEWLRGGMTTMLTCLLRKRFGELPEGVQARLNSADRGQLEYWGEHLLDVATLDELFQSPTPAATHSHAPV